MNQQCLVNKLLGYALHIDELRVPLLYDYIPISGSNDLPIIRYDRNAELVL